MIVQPGDTNAPESTRRGLLDTSVFIAAERGRPLGPSPDDAFLSVVTLAELNLGVLMAADPEIRALRLRTLAYVHTAFDALPIDGQVATICAELNAAARRQGKRPRVNDLWIAATAVSHDLPVYTQDDDFLAIPLVRVVRI